MDNQTSPALCTICGKPITGKRAYENDQSMERRKYHGALCRYLATSGYFRAGRFCIHPEMIEVMKIVLKKEKEKAV